MRSLLGLEVTADEYRANLNGMNTFFGAVLGFVLSDVATANLREFAQLLLVTAAIVVSILYVSASPKRWMYAALSFVFIWAFPRLLADQGASAGRLQVTLAVWTGMTIFVEALWWWQQRRDARAGPPTA
jgi:hypothetical protein